MKILNIFGRLLALPFIIGLSFVGTIVLFLKLNINFLRFGGEFIPYYEKNEKATIAKIYYELKNQL